MSVLIVAAVLTGSAQPPETRPQPPLTRPPAEQLPAPTPTPTAAPETKLILPAGVIVDPDRRTAQMLLERIQTLVDDALAEKSGKSEKSKSKSDAVGTTGSLDGKVGRVCVDRAMLDEIHAEVSQIQLMLKR